ncbi:MAG: polysaccharide deacetylase family protein [Bryobacteraceae bacterium]|nr:polysaccharide deacetylase family protein [Bryobacteraceae bacterium]
MAWKQTDRSAILAYHSLDPSGSAISVTPERFRGQVNALVSGRVPVVPLPAVQKSPGSVALTFDDAFGNLREHALPLLAEHRLPATVFVVSGYCGKRNDWDQGPYGGIPSLPLMTWSELNELAAAGIELGAHTASHPNLAAIPIDRAREELVACRKEIEDRTGRPVRSLAYPFGASTAAVRGIAQEIFDVACGTELRFVSGADDRCNLPRLDVYYLQKPSVFQRVVVERSAAYIALRNVLRRVRRIL